MGFRSVFGVILLAGLPLCATASCPEAPLEDPQTVRVDARSVLLVVHASSTYDARLTSKRGTDEAVRFAREQGMPVIHLQDETPARFYFTEDCAPDRRVRSEGGEVRFALPATQLYVVGGHLELCLMTALEDILYQWAAGPPTSRTVTYLMDGIYSNGKMVDPGDPFYADFQRFMGVVSYARPGGEHWPKLSLLETMGVIVREDHQLEYLRQVLPRWDTTFPPNYRIEVQLNDSVKKVLRAAPGWNPPTLLFHFVDSAVNLASPVSR